jgi:nitric oxide reductase NorQ protein
MTPHQANKDKTLNKPMKTAQKSTPIPFYQEIGDECAVFEMAFKLGLPLLLKGPTGCGKTRFVAHMAARLGLPLNTVACHDDLAAADLTGRYLLKGGETIWADGPLTSSVRKGGICYLDEIVEARKDVTVVIHPLTDDRRILPLDRTGEILEAPDNFMLVVSYNPGYQNILKSLKPSTRQRFLALEFDFPPPETEKLILERETGLDGDKCDLLVRLAAKLRALKGQDIEEGVSTRLLVYCASLIKAGMSLDRAIDVALIEPLTDDADVKAGLKDIVQVLYG